jgi:type III restriction enzyme
MTLLRQVHNAYLLKSPVNVVLTNYKPELEFAERVLFNPDNVAALKTWVKAPDVGFYDIEYGYQPAGNGRSKRGRFNPDYFLLREDADEVIVVETKANDDVTDVNAGKLAHALAHFDKLNDLLEAAGEDRRYQFIFLSPVDYDDLFAGLRDGNLEGFVPTLQAALST